MQLFLVLAHQLLQQQSISCRQMNSGYTTYWLPLLHFKWQYAVESVYPVYVDETRESSGVGCDFLFLAGN